MDDDLGCPLATAALFDYVGELYSAGIEAQEDPTSLLAAYQTLTQHLWVLGIEYPDQRLFPELAAESFPVEQEAEAAAPYRTVIDRMLELRQKARADKDFARADLIRDLLAEAGLVVEDTPRGPRWELAGRE
jgi:cysteinyl-tRNA synthetase